MTVASTSAAPGLARPEPRFIQTHFEDTDALRHELLAGLAQQPSTVSPKFLYDALGSRLFDAITELPEYYLTRSEAAILRDHAAEIAAAVGPGCTLIDLGAGSCVKGARLLQTLRPQRYVAVDISVQYLRDALTALQAAHPALPMTGVGMDFSVSLPLPVEYTQHRTVFFYAGSSIGNFSPSEALAFLVRLRERCSGGGVLIGVDLVKPTDVLEPAYDDALGVTAAFNRNLLLNLNRTIGSDFEPAQWRHVAFYASDHSRIEMHLEAGADVCVRWPGGERHYTRGDRIHTENSQKYTAGGFAALLHAAGFAQLRLWSDERGWFAVFWASA